MTERAEAGPRVLGAELPPVERLVNLTEHAVLGTLRAALQK